MCENGMRRERTGRTVAAGQDRDAATAGHSPGPWRVEETVGNCRRIVVDAAGLEVAMCFGEVSEEVDVANAELICRAVNAWLEKGNKERN